jgi:archaemetzincin
LNPVPAVDLIAVRDRAHRFFFVVIFAGTFLLLGCERSIDSVSNINSPGTAEVRSEEFAPAMQAVKPFFKPLPPPGPNDWLATFKEPGQTFAEYINSNPTIPTDERKTLYVLPLGTFTNRQVEVIRITSMYLEAFFGLDVKILPQQSIKRPLLIKNRRINAISKEEQIRTGYILDDLLKPMLPDDAAALIAFTSDDLFPDNSMNYVFGQASLGNRVGVWSLYRLDDNADLKTFLSRTIKIAAHETGHMFSMHHCIAYNCVMSGSNHLAETDSHPIDACPECMAKVCWLSHALPAERYQRLERVCRENGLVKEADEFKKKYASVDDLQ